MTVGSDVGVRGKIWLEAGRKRSARSRCPAGGHRRSRCALQAGETLQANGVRLGQLEQGNAAGGHALEVETRALTGCSLGAPEIALLRVLPPIRTDSAALDANHVPPVRSL